MFMSLSSVNNNNKTVRKGALIGIGALIDIKRGEEQNREEGEMVQKTREEGEIGTKL